MGTLKKGMVNYDDNKQALETIEAMQNGENICLIGKAGTGKTTLVKHLKVLMAEFKIVTLAPTGIAAINAEGRTIHSLFHFPFRPLLPSEDAANRQFLKLEEDNKQVLRSIDVLIIDEISMVRADILDCIDKILRLVNESPLEPFGGTQILMVGDPFQLPPVVTNRPFEDFDTTTDKEVMDKHYKSPFFFASEIFRKNPPKVIELLTVYRQSDSTFVDILNGIRDGRESARDLAHLNKRVAKSDKESIYLTSTRSSADDINEMRLNELGSPVRKFVAKKTGYYPFAAIPQDTKEVSLRVGAKVMTTFNDPSGAYVNGSIGTITAMGSDYVQIELDQDYAVKFRNITVPLCKLQHFDITGKMTGTYAFMPVKTAWAITIHKSQGLTFTRVNVCPMRIFASGQLYVALSRCRSLEGMILTDPVLSKYIKVDPRIKVFMKAYAISEETKP